MRALLVALLAALPAVAAVPGPAPGLPPAGPDQAEPAFLLREDPDGNRTLLLLLEDDPAGPYSYRPLLRQNTELREVGTYTHPWTWNALPELTLGLYAVSASQRLLRVPLVVLEHAPSEGALADAVTDAALRYGAGAVGSLVPLAEELLAPELGEPGPFDFAGFQDFPPVVAWHARRALPGAELWLGSYVDRDGWSRATPDGMEGARSAEMGVMARVPGQDLRLAGAYVEQRASASQAAGQSALVTEFTAGSRSPAGRVPLATLRAEDARVGVGPGDPSAQDTLLSLGVHGPQGFTPLAGARTELQQRPHAEGIEVTRTTSLGVFVQGAWTPLAGLRYHGDRNALSDLPFALARGGALGSNQSGDAELSVGAFPRGSYEPLAQVALDDRFAGGLHAHQTMVTLGAFTPLRYQPLASATYDGTHSLLDWALRATKDDLRGSAWLVSAGPWAGSLYAPVLGVRFQGKAPGSTQAHEAEVAAGTFVLGYPNFVALAAASASSEEPFMGAALRMATQGPGHEGGAWQAGVGSYAAGQSYTPLAHARYVPVQDPEAPASADVVVSLAGRDALGVQYRGQAPLLQAFGSPSNLSDDRAWRAAVGLYAPGFVPLLRVAHDGQGSTVVVGPDL